MARFAQRTVVSTGTDICVSLAEELITLSAGLNALMVTLEPAEFRQLILTRILTQDVPDLYLDSMFFNTGMEYLHGLRGQLRQRFPTTLMSEPFA